MTVAAIVLAASPDSALADADGVPAVRRIADTAWSGGATPIVVVSFDPDGAVAASLAGAAVTLAEPAPAEHGPSRQMVRGIEVALRDVRDVSAALLWPARLTWVGAETVTSLLEAHGVTPGRLLRPAFDDEAGWPVLVPVEALEALRGLAPSRMPPEIIDDLAAAIPTDSLDLGDPGTTHDHSTARADLPPYVGPGEPPGGHVHEWGAPLADEPDDGPLEGPALAPYAPAGVDTADD